MVIDGRRLQTKYFGNLRRGTSQANQPHDLPMTGSECLNASFHFGTHRSGNPLGCLPLVFQKGDVCQAHSTEKEGNPLRHSLTHHVRFGADLRAVGSFLQILRFAVCRRLPAVASRHHQVRVKYNLHSLRSESSRHESLRRDVSGAHDIMAGLMAAIVLSSDNGGALIKTPYDFRRAGLPARTSLLARGTNDPSLFQSQTHTALLRVFG